MKRSLAPLLLAALLTGCVSQSGYLNNRAADAVDILRGGFLFGAGAGVKLEATRLLHGGIFYSHRAYELGLANREAGVWRRSAFSWGLLVGHSEESSTEPYPFVSGSYGWNLDTAPGEDMFQSGDQGSSLEMLTFRGTIMLVVGIDVEFRLGELIDFLAGIAQFDPSGDDVHFTEQRGEAQAEGEADRPAPPTGPKTGAG